MKGESVDKLIVIYSRCGNPKSMSLFRLSDNYLYRVAFIDIAGIIFKENMEKFTSSSLSIELENGTEGDKFEQLHLLFKKFFENELYPSLIGEPCSMRIAKDSSKAWCRLTFQEDATKRIIYPILKINNVIMEV